MSLDNDNAYKNVKVFNIITDKYMFFKIKYIKCMLYIFNKIEYINIY